MGIRTRKFIGAIGIVVLLAVYLPVAMVIGGNHFAGGGVLAQVGYFLVAGIAWVLPAGLLVRWMQRPDPEKGS